MNRNDLAISNRITADILEKYGIKSRTKERCAPEGYYSIIEIHEINYVHTTRTFTDKDELTVYENDVLLSKINEVLFHRKVKATKQQHESEVSK
jgi:hypothetical protein